jgi:calcineurin-like phosphoesterase family protein
MSKIFFTADNHFGHKAILHFCADKRGNCQTVEEMDELMIANHNMIVSPKDEVYFLGDFSFHKDNAITQSILKRLNGRKYLIKGNHDYWVKDKSCVDNFEWIVDYKRIKIDKQSVVLFHYPIVEFDRMHYGAYHAYGHVHGNYTHPGRAIDVSIDARPGSDMMYWEWPELRAAFVSRPVIGHHDRTKLEPQYT